MTSPSEIVENVPGGPDLLAWFGGRFPSFHDAEVVGLTLDRERARCRVRVHAFQMTPEVDADGYYVCINHAVITFALGDVVSLELEGFGPQNPIDGLTLVQEPDGGFRLELEPCGDQLGGAIVARGLSIEIEPGIPSDSIYLARLKRRSGQVS
jgi:hypothetical protein